MLRLSVFNGLDAVSRIEPENEVISGTVILSPGLTVFLNTITVLALDTPLTRLDSRDDSKVRLSLLDGPVLRIKETEFGS